MLENRDCCNSNNIISGNPVINDNITLVSADGTSLTYSAKSSGPKLELLMETTGAATAASELKAAIEDGTPSTGGHGGKITVLMMALNIDANSGGCRTKVNQTGETANHCFEFHRWRNLFNSSQKTIPIYFFS